MGLLSQQRPTFGVERDRCGLDSLDSAEDFVL